jgi:hypothetical protein
LHVCCYVCFAYISTNTESRIPRFAQRLVRNFVDIIFWKKKQLIPSISSFNRSGIEPSSTSSSQAPHHLMRGQLRETYNPKSASLSATSSSTQQQQQHVSKIPEKIKCVFSFKNKIESISPFRQL